MQSMGLEPTPEYTDMNLNHARMPIPPRLQELYYFIIEDILCQEYTGIFFLKKIKNPLANIKYM